VCSPLCHLLYCTAWSQITGMFDVVGSGATGMFDAVGSGATGMFDVMDSMTSFVPGVDKLRGSLDGFGTDMWTNSDAADGAELPTDAPAEGQLSEQPPEQPDPAASSTKGASKLFNTGDVPESGWEASLSLPSTVAAATVEVSQAPRRVGPQRRQSFSKTGLSVAEIDTASERFVECCEALGVEQLTRPAFKMLVKQIIAEDSVAKPPKPKDLDAAFLIADTDRTGTIDHDEFVVLVGLVKEGAVHGIGGSGFFKQRKARRSSVKFETELEAARAEAEAAAALEHMNRGGRGGHTMHGEEQTLPVPR